MASYVQHRRRASGAAGGAGSPGGAGLEGEIAINFNGNELWAYGGTGPGVGTGWQLMNPNVTPKIVGVTSGSPAGTTGVAVEAAFNATGTVVNPGDIVIFTHPVGGTAYIYNGPASVGGAAITGATGAQFTALGAAMAIATPAQVAAGTDNSAALTPSGLASVIPPASLAKGTTSGGTGSTGVPADQDKIVVLSTGGKIDPVLLGSATAAEVRGGTNPTGLITNGVLGSLIPVATLTAGTTGGGSPATGVAGDANKLVVLGAAGKINPALIDLATGPEVEAGADATKLITPQALAGAIPAATLTAGVTNAQPAHSTNKAAATGVAGDHDRIVVLDANGKIDPALMSVQGFTFKSADLTASPAPSGIEDPTVAGTVIVNSATGNPAPINVLWTNIKNPPASVSPGDMLISDGTEWHHIENTVDLSNVVTKSGAQALADDWTATMAVPASTGMVTRLDGSDAAKSQISNFNLEACTLDGGTF